MEKGSAEKMTVVWCAAGACSSRSFPVARSSVDVWGTAGIGQSKSAALTVTVDVVCPTRVETQRAVIGVRHSCDFLVSRRGKAS